jgi:hypothetical protein
VSRQPKLAKLQAQCDAFNALHPVGTRVTLKKDFVREPFETRTRSEAQVLSGHSAVIWLDGVTGCYALDCVTVPQQALAVPVPELAAADRQP